MPIDRRKLCVFGAAVALRLVLILLFPGLPDLLTGRVEVSTPISSFKRLQEGLFLYLRDVSPYDGGVFHQAPILLPLFSLIPQSHGYTILTVLVYTLLDLINANALIEISSSGESVVSRLFTSPRKKIRWDGIAIVVGYLFNPFTIATCLGRPTTAFTNSAIIYAISNAIAGRSVNSMLALGLASYLSVYPALLFPPLVLLCYDHYISKVKSGGSCVSYVASHSLIFAADIAGFLVISYGVTGYSWDFISATYGAHLLVPDLTPNAGLWWYFLIEIFDPFREFFLGPLFVMTCLLGIFAIFKPYPGISDVSIYLSFLSLYRHIFPLMRYTFLSVSALLYASLLGPIFYHLWIYAGSGNANFFYAITLVWSLGLSILVADSLYAVLRDEWDEERPEVRGKEARQI
ncbi:GPI transamidase component PIG-U [Trichophyton violaceum]|uniref:GPI transamidase component PIG-U n=1 Tax=Trichophyton violaceum TaxID=34388 RepID=A0A178FQI4_TRIVO|nr:GPI transamidase component PIG-U [Trichophyton violaceum]